MHLFGLVCLALVFVSGCSISRQSMAPGGTTESGDQSIHVLRKEISRTVSFRYLLYLPKGYGREGQVWPLMLFLHGVRERGSDIELVTRHGPPKLIEEGEEFPFLVVSPQCPPRKWWTEMVDTLAVLLDDVVSKYAVDPSRVYLTGLSMGGSGAWALGCRYPERFAAIAPICGDGERFLADRLKNVPVWAFHGARDPVVPLRASEEMVDALKRAGGNVQLTVYPRAAHDSWTETYKNPKLYEWFLSHRKNEESR